MKILLISIFGAAFVYFMINMLIPPDEKDLIKKRVNRLATADRFEDIQDQVIKKRHGLNKKATYKNIRWISKEFANSVIASGVKLTPTEYLYAWIASAITPMIFIFIVIGNGITAVGFGIIGFSIPPFLLSRARKKRQELFTKQLGEAVVIIGNCLKGGFSFRQAMESIVKDMQPPISTEFEMTIREMRYGVEQEEALKHMTERVKNQDFDIFVSAVLTSIQVGSNLSEILDTIAGTIKDRIRIKQEVRVLTSQGRISGIIIGLLPVFIVVMVMIINPVYFSSFFQSTIGKIMIIISVLLEIIGFSVIRKIADIKY